MNYFFKKAVKTLGLFLDRDGVINVDSNYVWRIDDFVFVDGIFKLCHNFQRAGYKIFVVTNQSGISRGFYSENDFFILTKWMIENFLNEGIIISKVYFCPHLPEKIGHCNCRKPKPGMIKQAEGEFNLDLQNSILLGDHVSDIMAGNNAGIGTNILINTNTLPQFLLTD